MSSAREDADAMEGALLDAIAYARWALVVSVAWLAIALYAPDDEPDEVDEKVGKEQK
ncbi:MAG TPA: hypothetical protein PLG04_10880 [Anaerolineaceae bacterium]|nr:hypothetical protein [Anaerolineaceae bacterium]